ncbi:hypothetical protein M5D96_011695, partial [Drosophila gunungcola]
MSIEEDSSLMAPSERFGAGTGENTSFSASSLLGVNWASDMPWKSMRQPRVGVNGRPIFRLVGSGSSVSASRSARAGLATPAGLQAASEASLGRWISKGFSEAGASPPRKFRPGFTNPLAGVAAKRMTWKHTKSLSIFKVLNT